MNFQQAAQLVQQQLNSVYDNREAKNITAIILEELTGFSATQRLLLKEQALSIQQEQLLQQQLHGLLQHKPVQQVLGYTWFYGNRFFVNEHTLIPRPETEELVAMVVNENKNKTLQVLDIGTGSGCIAISIKKQMPFATVTAIDISAETLMVAKKNAAQLEANINFIEIDFLNETQWQQLPQFDIIVSNPPYILQSESVGMNENVLGYEPHTALFVPDNDALIFYEKIAAFADMHLAPNGCIWVEMNEAMGKETVQVFEKNHYAVSLIKDMQDKDRMIKAIRLS